VSSDVRITTGQSAFDYGVDSSRVPLIQSQGNPNGLQRTALAWLVNGTTRGGGITPRFGQIPLCRVHDGSAIYQGGLLYDNSLFGGNPYLMLSIGGRMYQVRVDTDNSVVDVTGSFQDPATTEKAYFTQGEQFMVKQAGDGVTLPLFWDGFTLRRSNGANFNQGTTNAGFVVPAVGAEVLVTLNSPFTGPVNQVLQLWDSTTKVFLKFVQVVPGNFITVKNIAASTGIVVTAGTAVKLASDGSTVGVFLADFTTPAVGASVAVKITPTYAGAIPSDVTIEGAAFQITATGAAAPGANQIYLVLLADSTASSVGNTITAGTIAYATRELPAAQSMVYYMGRLWYSQNRKCTAGDIVGGPSGTVEYQLSDAILKVTENPLALAGDGFTVPGQAGNIRALSYPIALDTALGQGPLFIFTTKQIYSLTVPVTRKDWIAADSNNQPLQRVVMRTNGTVSDRSVVAINGDLFFQSLDPAIRSFFMALRYFGSSWANPPISNNINRALDNQDRGLMHMCSGMEFGERVYQTTLPFQTTVGVAFKALAVLDTDPVSTLQDQKQPVWEGISTGLNILQVFSGDFGGLERAFAVVHSEIDGSIWVWELSSSAKFNGTPDQDNRTEFFFETPSFDFSEYSREAGGGSFELKEIDGLDLWLDRVFGDVLIKVQFRPDEDQCWYDWDTTEICSGRTCAEDVNTPACYPITSKTEGYRMPISFPKPTNPVCSVGNPRPVTWGGKFQLKFTIKGWCRVRGFEFHCLAKNKSPNYNQICTDDFRSKVRRQIIPTPPTPPPTNGEVFGNPDTGEIFGDSSGDEFGVP